MLGSHQGRNLYWKQGNTGNYKELRELCLKVRLGTMEGTSNPLLLTITKKLIRVFAFPLITPPHPKGWGGLFLLGVDNYIPIPHTFKQSIH
jgi:hypothetical protein